MIYYLLPIIIILLICICAVFYFDNRTSENFLASSCSPDNIDIAGIDIKSCVQKCSDNNSSCSKDSNGNQINVIAQSTEFLNKYPNISIKKPQPSDPELRELIALNSPCLQKCLKCGWGDDNINDSCKCNWSNKCINIDNESYEKYKDNTWDSSPFILQAIPESNKVVLSWNEEISESDIESYILFIFQKNNISEVRTEKITINSPKLIKTNEHNYMYIIDKDIINNIQYGIQLNKISNKYPTNKKLVKTSNTIYVVPSEENLINFSNVKKNSNEQCSYLAENLLDNFKGKEFDINFG
jgi:hypothetical protein